MEQQIGVPQDDPSLPGGTPGRAFELEKPRTIVVVDGVDTCGTPAQPCCCCEQKSCTHVSMVMFPIIIPLVVFMQYEFKLRFLPHLGKMLIEVDYYLQLWKSKEKRIVRDEAPLSEVDVCEVGHTYEKEVRRWAIVLKVRGAKGKFHCLEIDTYPMNKEGQADAEAAVDLWKRYLQAMAQQGPQAATMSSGKGAAATTGPGMAMLEQPPGVIVPGAKPRNVKVVGGMDIYTRPEDYVKGCMGLVICPCIGPWSTCKLVIRFDKQNGKVIVILDYYLKLWQCGRFVINEAPLSQVSAEAVRQQVGRVWDVKLTVTGGSKHESQTLTVASYQPVGGVEWEEKAKEDADVW
eukprot:CAMPEP_0178410400 /NCGR_PEP_ID=MMETSP0689_2-20121128/20960_1 /TAXON_ID=160604 /ORGANISM="Amphidinium massartii, Strain CS-259" /LENGTH=347 /DNA_ID=CAMNT_0020031575 /DNA_START=32 /DNA_END=1072 /DNA_ORIENTATION=-